MLDRGALLTEILKLSDQEDNGGLPESVKKVIVNRFYFKAKGYMEKAFIYISFSRQSIDDFRLEQIFEVAKGLQETELFNVVIDKSIKRESRLEEVFQEPIDSADVFLLFFTDGYKASDICANEVAYAERRNKQIIAIRMDLTPWGRWLNLYLGEHRWLDFDDDQSAAEMIPLLCDKIKMISLQPPPRRCSEHLTTIDIPSYPLYYPRQDVEESFLAKMKSVCNKPANEILILSGPSGIGKTALVARVLLDPDREQFLTIECGIHVIIWLNCTEWKDANSFNKVEQVKFVDKLLALGKRAAVQDPQFSRIQFFEIDDIVRHFRKVKKSVLFVFDSVYHTKIVETFRRKCRKAACCMISKNAERLKNSKCQFYFLPNFSINEIVDIFEILFNLEGKLTQSQLRDLANLCDGSPLIARLVATRMVDADSRMYENEYSLMMAKEFSFQPTQKIAQLFDYNMSRAELREPCLRQLFFAVLLFEKGEPICVQDMAILWGYEGEMFERGVLRARGLCRVLERKGIFLRLQDYSSDKEDFFIVHDLIFDAAMTNAQSYFKTEYVEEIRMKIASGSCRAAFIDPDISEEIMFSSSRMIAIASEAIFQCQRGLVEKIVDKISPKDLAQLLQAKSEKTSGRTFLHHLYNFEWPDNVRLRWNLSLGVNHSYRLIDRILEKVKKQNEISMDSAYLGTDGFFNSFLIDIFKQESNALHSVDRDKVLRYLTKWKYEYRTAAAEKEMIESFSFHAATVCTVKGDFNGVSFHLSSPTILDPATQQEIDRNILIDSCLKIAARHGHCQLFEFIQSTFVDPIKLNSDELAKAFMLAAGHGHVDIIQILFGEQKCNSFARDEFNQNMTAIMHAARGGHLSVIEFLFIYAEDRNVLNLQDDDGNTALMHAAMSGHERLCQALFRMNADSIKFTNFDGLTALSFSAIYGFLNLVEFFHNNYPEAVEIESLTKKQLALTLASIHGHLGVVKFIYSKYKDAIKATDVDGWTALTHAAQNGHYEVVTYLYDRYPSALKFVDKNGINIIMAAAQRGHAKIVEFSISKQAIDLQATSNEGLTAFQLASFNGHLSVVKLLAEKDMSLTEVTAGEGASRKFSGLEFAVMRGHLNIVQYLYNKSETNTRTNLKTSEEQDEEVFGMLVSAVLTGNIDVVAFLCEQHPHAIRQQDIDGQTALMIAASWGYSDIVEFLYFKQPFIIGEVDNEGCWALLKACTKGSLEVAEFLFERFPESIGWRSNSGTTCLMEASEKGHLAVVEYLIKRAGDTLLWTNELGETALMLAAAENHVTTIRFLFEKGGFGLLSMKDSKGLTALSHAARNGRLEACRFICEKKAALAAESDSDQKFLPIVHAIVGDHFNVADYLYQQFPDSVYSRDKTQRVPIQIAAELGNSVIIKFLFEKNDEAADMQDASGNTAVTVVVKMGKIKLVEYFIEKRSESLESHYYEDGMSLFSIACKFGHVEVAELLLKANPKFIDAPSENAGIFPISYATINGHLPVIEFLYSLQPGCIDMLDRSGNTPLAYAILSGQSGVIPFLTRHMKQTTIEEMLTGSYSPESIVAASRFQNVMSTSEEWTTLYTELRIAIEVKLEQDNSKESAKDPENAAKIETYPNISANVKYGFRLNLIYQLTEDSEKFCQGFIESGGLALSAEMLKALLNYSERPSSPVSRIRSFEAGQLILKILANICFFENLRIPLTEHTDLIANLNTHFGIDPDGGADSRPILAGFVLTYLTMAPTWTGHEETADQIISKIKSWSDVVINHEDVNFKNLKQISSMLVDDDSSHLMAAKYYGVWLLVKLQEVERSRYRAMMLVDNEHVSKQIDRLLKMSFETTSSLWKNLAKIARKLL